MWTYQGREVTEDEIESHVGFVYLITNLTNNKKYVGKKLFKSTRTKTIKGKRKKVKSDSDWRDYYGSNAILKEDVKLLGPENFKREILKLCKSKGECSYYEAKFQFEYDVLLSDDWYNTWIMCKIRSNHLPK